ncbi:hypothetical protein V3C99_011175 [Haemonchus contortus]
MDCDSEVTETNYSRDYFVELVDKAQTEDEIADLITLFGTLNGNELELALPSLYSLAEKSSEAMKSRMMDMIHLTLTDENSSRSIRKGAISCLKALTQGKTVWYDYFLLAQGLEEPQFHILVPILPRLDCVMQLVYSNLLDFKWVKVLFIRAFAHSNGWIRLWALEKLVAVEPKFMASVQDFLFSMLQKHLDSNDLFWRLLERQKLRSFLESLAHLLEGIHFALDNASRGNFVRKVIRSACQLSSPSSMFFISKSLEKVNPSRCLTMKDFPSVITLLKKTRYIQHITMRLATIFNYTVFFSKALELNDEAVNEVGVLTAFFSREVPSLLDTFVRMKASRELLSQQFEPHDIIKLALLRQRDFQKDDFAALLWVRARLCDHEDQLQKLIELELADRLMAVEDGVDMALSSAIVEDVDTLLNLLCTSTRDLTSVDIGLAHLIHGYILLRCAVTTGTEADCYIIHTVYVRLLGRLNYPLKSIADLAVSLISEEGIPLPRETLLVGLLNDIFDKFAKDDKDELIPKISRYLGTEALAPVRRTVTDFSHAKDISKLTSTLHEYRLKLIMKCHLASVFDRNVNELVKECVDWLECASTYSVADCYLNLVDMLVEKVSCKQTLLGVLTAAFSVMNEERKSQHFLPALRRTLRLCLKRYVMAQPDVTQLVLGKCSQLLELAHLNTPVALTLSQCLSDSCMANPLSEEWATIVFALAVFGPIPKKEHRVLNAAYEMIYEERVNDFNDIHRPFEVLQRTRLNGICIALRISKSNPNFAKHLVEHIISETNSLNLSSSRSFGLSLAHRQNTRAAALLLLISNYVQDEDAIEEVFSNCVDWIVDPCQQFSIKLLLEWVLVRLATRSSELKQRVVDLERSFANKRIGSVSSWINMMVLMSRLETEKASLPFYIELILPWTTAQNFAVRCTAIAALRLLYSMVACEKLDRWNLVRRVVEFDSEPSGNSKRIVENLVSDFYFAHLHPTKHFDMQTILTEIPSRTGMPSEETIGVDLLKKFNSSEVPSCNEDSQFLSAQSLVYSALSKSNRCAPDINEDGLEDESLDNKSSSLVQRKLITKERILNSDCSIVVVASLVDKPNNLGGLCRTCEIFGVDQLVIADPIFVSDVGFKALSMSSEKKQKIEFVRPEQLMGYLEEMRQKGYTVIAAEQTTDSAFLHKFNFPKKTVLVLGDEKEGVPVNLLRCVDQTVEIQQLGQTRSLNVHVSAALFIARYAEQNLLG